MNEKNPDGIVFDITRNMNDALNNVEHLYAQMERIRNFLLGAPETTRETSLGYPHKIVPVSGWLLQQRALSEYLVCYSAKIEILLNDLLKEGMDIPNLAEIRDIDSQ